MGVEETRICKLLVERGKSILEAPPKAEPLAPKKPRDLTEIQHKAAKSLINDLKHRPHAFVIACIMDRQIAADRAWLNPYRLAQRIGYPKEPRFSLPTLLELSKDDIQGYMKASPSLHWLHKDMSRHVYSALRRIAAKYEGRAEKIWDDLPSSARLVYRFLEFEGIGPKIATMAANILVRDFKIPVSDHFSIDISPDVHVGRVLPRLGLLPERATREQIIYRVRDLNPEFPGLLDLPAYEIGQNWCKPKKPRCDKCFMSEVCPTAARLTP